MWTCGLCWICLIFECSWGNPSWISALSGYARYRSYHYYSSRSPDGRRKCELYWHWKLLYCVLWSIFFLFKSDATILNRRLSSPMQEEKAKVIQTVLFVAGLNTLLQSYFGTRLPAVIGASYTFVAPTISIILSGRWSDPDPESVSVFRCLFCTLLFK